jgi:hypothetical protein
MRYLTSALVVFVLAAGAVAAQAPPPPPPPPPPPQGAQPPRPSFPGMPQRDEGAAKTGTAVLRGSVVSAETGLPVRRAQVRAVGADPRDARSVSTDEQGRWELTELPAGRYSIHMAKAGFVGLSYGQRRPFEQGRPVDLADGQVLEKLEVALPKGSVIAGSLHDEFGEPVAFARVSAMRYRFLGGQRRLVAFGGQGASAVTDDLGQFRLHGLSPGDYYLSASSSTSVSLDRSDDRIGYLPTYYPGTAALGEAQRITVGLGQESTGVTFAMVPSRVASISGFLRDSSGKPLPNTTIRLMSPIGAGPTPLSRMSMTRPDGAFTLSNVPPGEYRLEAEAMDMASIASVAMTGSNRGLVASESASLALVVEGKDVAGLDLVTAPGARLTGRVRFERAEASTVPKAAVMIQLMPAEPGVLRMGANFSVNDDWTVEGTGLSGRMIIRGGSPGGWHLKSVTVDGHDVTDTGIAFTPGQSVEGLEILLTREMASLTGTVQGSKGEPLTDFVVVAFADDPARWGYLTRFVRAGRPDQSGKFLIEGLPPGSYRVVALEYLEPGDEQDPETLERLRGLGTPVTARDGEQKTVTLKGTWGR